jgi:hypothetical protein
MPVGPARFAVTGSVEQISIERSANGTITGLRVYAEGDGEGDVWTRTGDLPQRADLSLSDAQKAELVGDYAGPQFQIKILLGPQGELLAQPPGQPAVPLKASHPRELYATVVDVSLRFEPEAGPAQTATLVQGPARIAMTRVPAAAK